MAAHDDGPAAQVVRAVHAAFNDRDRDRFLGCLAEDAVWNVEGNNPMAGSYLGREAAWERYFAPLWPSPARVEDDEIVVHGEHVVAFAEAVHDFGEGPRGWKTVEVFRVVDGHVSERSAFTTGQEELDRFLTRGCAAGSDAADLAG
ncbi:MAG TPA: nuclear transport factor 2 family protein [Egibacteraceae bacterium]|nr:nuclear transport factor 2 family protein [Egibacteraceae bacterium]